MSLSGAVSGGDYRRSLEALRDELASAIENSNAIDHLAPLARQLTVVLDKLDKLPSAGEVTPLDRIASNVEDELASRRATRKPDASGGTRAGGRSAPGP